MSVEELIDELKRCPRGASVALEVEACGRTCTVPVDEVDLVWDDWGDSYVTLRG